MQKPKLRAQSRIEVSRVVVALYFDPVVATCESLVCQHAETPSVVANR
jgi:hypothetical protein